MSFFVHAGMTCVMIGMPTGFVWHRASAVVFIIVLLFDFVVGHAGIGPVPSLSRRQERSIAPSQSVKVQVYKLSEEGEAGRFV
jgi:hypothetical protein